MFDFDAGKLIVIGIVALIAIPSKDLPRVLRQVGQAVGRVRRMAAEFQGQFMEAMREAELHDIRADFEKEKSKVLAEVDSAMAGVGAFDPLTAARKEIVDAVEGPPAPPAVEPPAPDEAPHESPLQEIPQALPPVATSGSASQ
jgi:sec-independent protein translocase protein TatB